MLGAGVWWHNVLPGVEENNRAGQYPKWDKDPDPSGKDIVIVEQVGPGMTDDAMAKTEFEGQGQYQPD